MNGWLRQIPNAFFCRRAKTRCNVAVDSSARVNWYALRSTAGGSLSIGALSIVNCRIDFDSSSGSVVIGERCYIGASHLVCHTGITLDNDVIISWGVTVVDHDSHSLVWSERANDVVDWSLGRKDWSKITVRPVVLCDKVWVGFGASILKGVTVGEGSVIAANSNVTKDVPPYTLVAGNPARVIRALPQPGTDHP
jgi:galactoside O-acetyltransferase